jgi:sulfopyruvate decarboxylase subunit alpha
MVMKISKQIISNLKIGGANFFLSVPCKLLANMITILEDDNEVYYSSISREEEGMGICAGAYLGNKLPCIMMQNTGIGNSVNSIVSLLQLYQMPVVFLISYRGTPGESVGAQNGMGSITKEILQTLRIPILHCSTENKLKEIPTFTTHAKIIERPVAILCDFNLMKED